MACSSDVFKLSEQEGCGDGGSDLFFNSAIVGPRISFSHDFAGTAIHCELGSYKEEPLSSDFKFSVKDYAKFQSRKRTLRDELPADDNDEDEVTRGQSPWTERWGLKESSHHRHRSKKVGKRSVSVDGMLLETVAED